MANKSRDIVEAPASTDLTNAESDVWLAANKARVKTDVAEARASLRRGEGRSWSLADFLARAKKRRSAKVD